MQREGDAARSECLPTGHWAIMSVIKQLPEDKYRRWDLWEALQDDPRWEKPFFTWDRGRARDRLIWQDRDYKGPPNADGSLPLSKEPETLLLNRRIESFNRGSGDQTHPEHHLPEITEQSEMPKVFFVIFASDPPEPPEPPGLWQV